MPRLTLHSLRSQTALLKYILVFVVLFSAFSAWHDTTHILNTAQECELCSSAIDLEHSIPSKANLFESETHTPTLIQLSNWHFYRVFVGNTGNRDPPVVIF